MEDKIKFEGKSVNSKGYGFIPKLVMQDKRLHVITKSIYAYFKSFTGAGTSCFPSRDKICFDLGISKDTFNKYLKQLCQCGYISVEQERKGGKFSSNVYIIHEIITNDNNTTDNEVTVSDITVSDITVYGEIATNNNNIKNNNIKNNNNIKERKKEEKKSSYDLIIDELVKDNELKENIYEFIKMRKLKKKPLTDRALKMLINKLNKYTKEDQLKMLENSIINSWNDVYELKDNDKKEQSTKSSLPEWFDNEIREEVMSREEEEEVKDILKSISESETCMIYKK